MFHGMLEFASGPPVVARGMLDVNFGKLCDCERACNSHPKVVPNVCSGSKLSRCWWPRPGSPRVSVRAGFHVAKG